MFCTRCLRSGGIRRPLAIARQFSMSAYRRAADPALSTPTTQAGEAVQEAPKTARSICPEGTVLVGLNYAKGGKDPVALKDEEYPEWLWKCMDVMKQSSEGGEDLGDEFSKSKKQRRLAAKRAKEREAQLLAEGNLEALAPKIPLQHQSINLPGQEGGSLEQNLESAAAREELKKAMRKERRAAIKESNYLKSF